MRDARFLVVATGLLAGCGPSGGATGPGESDASIDVPSSGDTSTDASGPNPLEASSSDSSSTTRDASGAPFADPNPLPCVGMDASTLCLMGWPDMSHPFTGCCLTTFPQDPQGKCGVASGTSPCFERKAPGNPDPSCPQGGNFDLCFGQGLSCAGGFEVGGSGTAGCCQWRTGTCGVVADDLGCIDQAQVIFQGTPCTPDYAEGSGYP
jgi:hypothetical protein